MGDESSLTRKMLEDYIAKLRDPARYAEDMRRSSRYEMAMYASAARVFGADPVAPAEPEQKCPSYRLVAEPCAQGTRLKRYEPVAGTAEMVLVSVEILRS